MNIQKTEKLTVDLQHSPFIKKKIVPKTIIRLAILLVLAGLLIFGFKPAKYLLTFYIFILFFMPHISAIYLLFLLFILPFLVYLQKNALAEYYAIGAYVFLGGGIIGYLIREKKILRKILMPITQEKVCHLITFIIFIFILLSPLILPKLLLKLNLGS